MFKIANICNFNEKNIYYNTFYEYENILKLINFIDNPVDNGLPTLIVGYDKTKELGFDVDIDNNKINEITYWCFSPDEFLNYFLTDFKGFLLKIPELLIKNNKHKIIDPFFTDYKTKEELFNFINSITIKNVYYRNNMVYINSDLIYIIDIKNYEYFEPTKKDLLKLLSNNNLKIDKDNSIFSYFQSIFPEIDIFLLEKNIVYFINLKK